MGKYRVLTFNLKNDMIFTRKYLKWETRKPLVLDLIRTIDADIIGVQEFTDKMKASFSSLNYRYEIVGKARNRNPKVTSERTDIFYKKSRFRCLETKTFWLSNTPNKEGSRLLLSPFPRICTMARLEDKGDGSVINVYNTHLDHLTAFTRTKEMEILLEHMSHHQTHESIIIMGDLNTSYLSNTVKILQQSSLSLQTVYQSNKAFNTMHFGSGKQNDTKQPIDYIFVSNDFNIEQTEIITQSFNGVYPSDHFPVLCILNKKNQPMQW